MININKLLIDKNRRRTKGWKKTLSKIFTFKNGVEYKKFRFIGKNIFVEVYSEFNKPISIEIIMNWNQFGERISSTETLQIKLELKENEEKSM